LLAFDTNEQCLEVSNAESTAPVALDDLKEEGRSILHGGRENLQQISFLILVDEDAQVLQLVPVLADVTDYRALLRTMDREREASKVSHYADMHVIQALARGGSAAAGFALLGYLLVHLSQHTATEHFHFGEETHAHLSRMAGATALVGLLLHTFFDGVAIASGFAVSQELGILVFLAILLHKLPEGVTIASLQVAVGRTSRYALGSAAVLGAATIVGVLLTDTVAFLAAHGLALSAGVTIYVAASNLVPEFQGKPGWRLPVAFFVGAGAFMVARAVL